ncbi:hypothetical protein METUNv1_03182 [Methyloversatilis universalis FAM5]|uniref:Uncharacterized protein n=1 Tax=Methyloversatilis universalis (strain ATCC BAA-1314 / DSM 25237 / JCM 13912 / CCUG 52030 / FAM5) TaxID=1000565 RepID=F5RFU5_METUF|nr:hypothetical protein [Methyloversatilis universalis]EGK70621.1 hypothetical protein METUNv1_03182 [Methyloversatilis universalis FAM5]
MDTQAALLIAEAREWLDKQPPAEANSARWYSLGNFQSFIAAIEADSSPQSIERASWSLGHHITDQLDWSSDYCKTISSFLQRARSILHDMQNG